MSTEKQVALTISLRGAQISRGSYDFFSVKTEEGEKSGVVTEKRPRLAQVKKQLILKEQFIEGALQSPPESMQMSEKKWKQLPENKRIGIHVKDYAYSTHPEFVCFSYEII